MTASAYVLLDKRKPLAAVGEFKRALNNSPNFPQALFGVGEAYRSAGDTAQAIDAYKKYLAAAPGGEDAPAARRQASRARGPAGAPQSLHDHDRSRSGHRAAADARPRPASLER